MSFGAITIAETCRQRGQRTVPWSNPSCFGQQRAFLMVLLVLAFQNLAIFWGHYFRNKGFPWDFPLGYYAFPAYWISSVELGDFPQWVPFQAMGYPFAMNLQTGLYYPPLWIFPLLGMAYTLKAAIVLQCLHVLFGSIGMYLFLTLKLKQPSLALVGAVAFQFFGGFYSNSEHVDIVRAFAFAPWFFYLFTITPPGVGSRIPRRVLFIPLAVFMLATGGYPGNLVSYLFIFGLYVFCQLFDEDLAKGFSAKFVIAFVMFSLMALGIAMAFVHLGPAWIEKAQLTRYYRLDVSGRNQLGLEHLPGLFLSNRALPGEISMASTYLTLPIMVFLFYIPLRRLKESRFLVIIGGISILMSLGSHSFLYNFLTEIFTPLGFSRMPSSDYRIIFAVILILFGAMGLQAALEEEATGFAARTSFAFIWVSMCTIIYYSNISKRWQPGPIELTLGQVFIIALLAVGLVKFAYVRKNSYALILALILIFADGFMVISDMRFQWRLGNYKNDIGYYDLSKYGYVEKDDTTLFNYDTLQNPPERRPARVEPRDRNDFYVRGYLAGDYVTGDIGSTELVSRWHLKRKPLYKEYMLKEWTALFFDPSTNASIPDDIFHGAMKATDPGWVRQTRYAPDEIRYKVSLKQPVLMVENEIYFEGWQARLLFSDRESVVKPLKVNDGLRAWLLPAGKYNMVSTFDFPRSAVYRSVSGIALFLWLLVPGLVPRQVATGSSRRHGAGDEGS